MPAPLIKQPNAGIAAASSKYDTSLDPSEERVFQKWAAQYPDRTGSSDYDMRGWWKENGNVNPGIGHFSDKYKKPNHPTFSTDSIYSGVDGNEGGVWVGSKKDGWTFTPGKTNLQQRTPDQLQKYWSDVELPSGNTLNLPGAM